ncbi:GNAT family N-acetyltransferase [Lentibacillus sp. CBA3610]|nr:GNAT family N-acetyltransferase [Lentibacillus sp. CBA3610]
MDIRLLEPGDAEVYKKLRLEALLNSPEAFSASYEEVQADSIGEYQAIFQSQNIHTFGAFESNELFGVVTLIRETKMKAEHRTTISGLYVTPYKRENGTGKTLMHTAIDCAKSLDGVEQVCLSVIIKRDTVKSLYYALGFVPFGVHKQAVKLGDTYFDEEYMVMTLG